ncbi:hypothetical protein Bca4012_034394 [Brassica carinata]
MEEELRDMKARKAHYDMLHFVADAQQGIPKLCPRGSITKESVDEEDTYDYLPGKRYFICKDFEGFITVIKLVKKEFVTNFEAHACMILNFRET